MNDSKISVRYSKAFLLSARETGFLERAFKDMELIQSTLSDKRFKEFLESPVIKTSEKKKLVREAFSQHLHPTSLNFFELILTNRREIYIEAIIRNFIALYRKVHGIKSASLKTAVRVTPEMKLKFLTLLEETFRTSIEMEEIIDPEMIGGFILKVEDEQFDASIKTSLSRIKKKLTETK
ncbi:MAG: ATP synthase F1 subunit delta [Bacteroidales bacterium]|nr:ATP synthase F1 subunit delta [Bacteroidales bacterium]